MKPLTAVVVGVAVTVAALTGCSPTTAEARPQLRVSGAYVPQPPMGDMAAGYFTITNTGRAADKLTSVTSDIATDVSMHTTTAAGQMRQVPSFPVPAGGSLVFRTGANHLMLMGLKRKPMVGDIVTFVLHFATSAPITVRAPVRSATYQPGQ